MNCKPNDLARIIDSPATRAQGAVDKIITVVDLCPDGHTPMWHYEPIFLCACGCLGEIHAIADSLLRPIRAPGDDVADESKAWLPPVPTTKPLEHA